MNTKFYAENLLGEALHNDQFLKEDGCLSGDKKKEKQPIFTEKCF